MIKVTVKGAELTKEEINNYIFYTKKRYGTVLPENLEMILEADGDYMKISYNPPFHFSAYRGTDYLVNDAEKLNESKFAELQEKIPNTLE